MSDPRLWLARYDQMPREPLPKGEPEKPVDPRWLDTLAEILQHEGLLRLRDVA